MNRNSPTRDDPPTPGQWQRIREIVAERGLTLPTIKTKGEATTWITRNSSRGTR